MRLVFFGSPSVAASTLGALVADGHEVVLVVTQADRRRGRGSALEPTPVKAVATSLGIPVTSKLADVADCGAELGVVVAFGRIIPSSLLASLPMVNLHLSLLPRWRGAAPVERAILAGDDVTGVSIMALDEGLDTGPVYATVQVPIDPNEHADALLERLGAIGTTELLGRLRGGLSGLGVPRPQEGESTYAAKIEPHERVLDFSASALVCHRVVRIGRAHTWLGAKRLLVHEAHLGEPVVPDGARPGDLLDGAVATGDGMLVLDVVQLEGRAAQGFSAFAAGARLGRVTWLGQSRGGEG